MMKKDKLSMNYLLHPELIHAIPLVGSWVATMLEARVAEALADDLAEDPNVSVVIRTLNEADKLEVLLTDIARQVLSGTIETVIVDNESDDHTHELAKKYGATLVSLPRRDFTYPHSMNLGVQAASYDTVFMTVGHAWLSSVYTLRAGARHFCPGSNVAGVFSMVLPSSDASQWEQWGSAILDLELGRRPRMIKKAGLGVMGATGSMLSKRVWQELGRFDERYRTGGEDTALAGKMLDHGYSIIKDPAVAVHHSHGFGFLSGVRELTHHVKTVRSPQSSSRVLARRRSRLVE